MILQSLSDWTLNILLQIVEIVQEHQPVAMDVNSDHSIVVSERSFDGLLLYIFFEIIL